MTSKLIGTETTANENNSQEIAQTIINQLGGINKISMMVGCKNLVALESGLQFSFKGSRKMNKVVIRLDASDTYAVVLLQEPNVPAGLDAVFQKMLAKRPEDRQQSMSELIAELHACESAG